VLRVSSPRGIHDARSFHILKGLTFGNPKDAMVTVEPATVTNPVVLNGLGSLCGISGECIAVGAQNSIRGLHSIFGCAPFNAGVAPQATQTAPTTLFSKIISQSPFCNCGRQHMVAISADIKARHYAVSIGIFGLFGAQLVPHPAN